MAEPQIVRGYPINEYRQRNRLFAKGMLKNYDDPLPEIYTNKLRLDASVQRDSTAGKRKHRGPSQVASNVEKIDRKVTHYSSQLNDAFGMIAALERQAEEHRAQIASLTARLEAIAPIRAFRVADQIASKPERTLVPSQPTLVPHPLDLPIIAFTEYQE